jgi:hypothetical protein
MVSFAQSKAQCGIYPKQVGIIAILIARGNLVDPLAYHLLE